MEYTFQAIFKPFRNSDVIRQRAEVNFKSEVTLVYPPYIYGGIPSCWLLKKQLEEVGNIERWIELYRMVKILSVLGPIYEMGIVFHPARRVMSGVLGGHSSASHYSDAGYYWYSIQSDTDHVKADSVGVFLAEVTNARTNFGAITLKQWESFVGVIYKYNQLFRAMKKLDQLRGQRRNPNAFDRLSAEVIEIMQTMI